VLFGAVLAQGDTFDSILRKAAIENGFVSAASTHVQGDKRLIPLGKRFFETKSLSLNSDVACRDCHLDEFGSADGIPLAVGIGGKKSGPDRAMGDGAIIPRNTLPLWGRGGVGFNVFFWDGKVDFSDGKRISQFGEPPPSDDPLVTMVHLPAVEIREMLVEDKFISGQKLETTESGDKVYDAIANRLRRDEPEAMAKLANISGVEVTALSFVHVASAIAVFIRDEFRVKPTNFHKYIFDNGKISEEARRGGLIFFGKGKCATCHSGPYFTDFGFYGIASLQLGFGKNGFGVDYGRYNVTHDPMDLYLFRTPPLLNVAKTAPYGHSGSLPSLKDAITSHFDPLRLVDLEGMSALDRHELYKRMTVASGNIIQMGYLDDDEVSDLVEFLKTLSY
jgi:cytochrome c peroxidase